MPASASASVTVPPPAARSRSIKARRAARVHKFKRERLVIDYLKRGVSIREIAVKLGVTEKRMRAIVKEVLAAHMPGPPEEFVALQISRRNEALLVAYSAMSGMNLKAVDRVVRIVRELDRYHGFFPAERRSVSDARRRPLTELKAEEPLALLAEGSGMAMQVVEIAQSVPDAAQNSSDEASAPLADLLQAPRALDASSPERPVTPTHRGFVPCPRPRSARENSAPAAAIMLPSEALPERGGDHAAPGSSAGSSPGGGGRGSPSKPTGALELRTPGNGAASA